jgi:hypothetical protein
LSLPGVHTSAVKDNLLSLLLMALWKADNQSSTSVCFHVPGKTAIPSSLYCLGQKPMKKRKTTVHPT